VWPPSVSLKTGLNPFFLNSYFTPLCRIALWLSIILFMNEFLQLKQQNKEAHKYHFLLYVLYLIPIVFLAAGKYVAAYTAVSVCSIISSIALLITGIWLYVIGYRPSEVKQDGNWRKLKIRLVQPPGLPALTVHNRQGYYAPSQ